MPGSLFWDSGLMDVRESAHRPRRVIPVLVAGLAVSDGQARAPVVGEVVGYHLDFSESSVDDEPDAVLVTVRARAEPVSDRNPTTGGKSWDGTPHHYPPIWPVRLHGDGWEATWLAHRPLVGEVELRGRFGAVIAYDSPTRVRGRVAAVDGNWAYLDLDDVPPLPLRPALVPGALAVHEGDLWVADTRLPLVVRVRDRTELTRITWPGAIRGHRPGRQLHADATGAWITGPDGIRRTDLAGTVTLPDPGYTTRTAATPEGTLAALIRLDRTNPRDPDYTLHLIEPTGQVTDVPIAGRSIRSLVSAGGGFLLLCTQPDTIDRPPDWDGRPWLARLDTTTRQLVDGPRLDLSDDGPFQTLIGSDPALLPGDRTLHPVTTELTVGPSTRIRLLGGYAAAGRVWIVRHPPHPSGWDGWWPLDGPPRYPEARRYWMLSELDPDTLQPTLSTLVPDIPEHLGVDDHGTVWSIADGVRSLPRTNGAAAELFNLTALLNSKPSNQ